MKYYRQNIFWHTIKSTFFSDIAFPIAKVCFILLLYAAFIRIFLPILLSLFKLLNVIAKSNRKLFAIALKIEKSDNFCYYDSWKSDNFTMSNREKSNTAIAILEKNFFIAFGAQKIFSSTV